MQTTNSVPTFKITIYGKTQEQIAERHAAMEDRELSAAIVSEREGYKEKLEDAILKALDETELDFSDQIEALYQNAATLIALMKNAPEMREHYSKRLLASTLSKI